MSSVSLPEEVRAACAWVAERARSVRIDEAAIATYAASLPEPGANSERAPFAEDPETAAAFAICMNAINFGSGWWPTIRKRPGHSGYATIAAGVTERFAQNGPWTVDELQEMSAATIARVVDQDPEHPLMEKFAIALRDVGDHLRFDYGVRFRAPAEAVDSIPGLAATFAAWDSFGDVSIYDGHGVPLYKRAQLAAADLLRAGVADLPGVDRLTAFADNLVPHVLRVDGILQLDPNLTSRIEAEELLEHGLPRGGGATRLRRPGRRAPSHRQPPHRRRDRQRPVEPRSRPSLQVPPPSSLPEPRLLNRQNS
jgi:hypothetical protein